MIIMVIRIVLVLLDYAKSRPDYIILYTPIICIYVIICDYIYIYVITYLYDI